MSTKPPTSHIHKDIWSWEVAESPNQANNCKPYHVSSYDSEMVATLHSSSDTAYTQRLNRRRVPLNGSINEWPSWWFRMLDHHFRHVRIESIIKKPGKVFDPFSLNVLQTLRWLSYPGWKPLTALKYPDFFWTQQIPSLSRPIWGFPKMGGNPIAGWFVRFYQAKFHLEMDDD